MLFSQTFEAFLNPAPKAVFLACFDLRFEDAIDEFPYMLGFKKKEFILMKIGGGPAPLAHPTVAHNRCKGLTKQLLFTCKKKFPESIERVILLSHEDCGYYIEFPCLCHGPDKEKRDLPLAGRLVQEALPNLGVELYHAGFLDGGKRIGFEEIQISQEVRTPPAEWTKRYQLIH